jgi:hypothetical protein
VVWNIAAGVPLGTDGSKVTGSVVLKTLLLVADALTNADGDVAESTLHWGVVDVMAGPPEFTR